MTNSRTAVIAAGLFMTAVQFIQNQLLFLAVWQDHFRSLGLEFATKPLNGILWMAWSFLDAYLLLVLLRALPLARAVLVAWLVGFVMMWCALYNLQVLPVQLLLAAVPISAAATFGSAHIIRRFDSAADRPN